MKRLSLEEVRKVAAGTYEEAMAYLKELHKKYGGKSILDVLERCTPEEFDQFMLLGDY